jgi:hypothetical protein
MHVPGLQLARPSAVIFQGSLRRNCAINRFFLRNNVYTSIHRNILVLGSTFPSQMHLPTKQSTWKEKGAGSCQYLTLSSSRSMGMENAFKKRQRGRPLGPVD